jgi:hypothetical protein
MLEQGWTLKIVFRFFHSASVFPKDLAHFSLFSSASYWGFPCLLFLGDQNKKQDVLSGGHPAFLGMFLTISQ